MFVAVRFSEDDEGQMSNSFCQLSVIDETITARF